MTTANEYHTTQIVVTQIFGHWAPNRSNQSIFKVTLLRNDMSESQVSPAVIRRTQELLGKYVKKPALSEKLLRKPPFRFLHDVINVVNSYAK